MKIKSLLLMILSIYPLISFSQPKGISSDIFNLINEARVNPKAFLAKYKAEIEEYEPKLILILEKSSPIDKLIWDEGLTKNCKERVYGNLNPQYKGTNEICGYSIGYDEAGYDDETIYFMCDSYTQIMNDEYRYFGFYTDIKGYTYTWGKTCNAKTILFESKEIIDSSKVNFKAISTANGETNLAPMDKEMIKEINYVRQYPKVYAGIIAKYLADESKRKSGISKAEYDAGIELIEELKAMSPAQLLYPKNCVYQAAKKHGEDCKKRGFSDHTGSDGSSPFTRISSMCPGLTGSENVVGGVKNARVLVIELLIDAGISGSGHRTNMLNPKWKYIGCYGYMGNGMYNYIQNFAQD